MTWQKIVKMAVALWVMCALQVLALIKQILLPVYRFFFGTAQPLWVRTPESRFTSVNLPALGHPFVPNYLEVPAGSGKSLRMHYIDEYLGQEKAEAEHVILCLHGEPSWSFLYRKMVPILVNAGYRVVVPDMIGFGRSDKYVSADLYNHELHTFSVKHLMDTLQLRDNVTLVCQDWGGLTGLTVVKDNPERFSNLVIMNTGLPVGNDLESLMANPAKFVQDFLPFLLWRSAVALFGTQIPLKMLFEKFCGFPEEVARAYVAPFPDSTYKGGVAKWPLMVPLFKDDPVSCHMAEARGALKAWQKPALIMFGDSDPITRKFVQTFRQLLPHARNETIKGAKHFLQETHGEELAHNIVNFLSKKL